MLLSFYPASSCDVDDCGGGGGGSRSTIMGSYMINDDDDKMIMMTASFPSFRKCSPEKWGVRELPRWKWVDGAQLVGIPRGATGNAKSDTTTHSILVYLSTRFYTTD
jgi:hypothetical protein